MKELQQILQRISQFAAGEKAILATVVDVVGSGYRRPGARMLIDRNGFGIGTISGGCLEADVLERAKKVLETGEPAVITYDTTKDENSLFGLGMGCRGIVRILLEPVEKESDLAKVLQAALERREPQLAATLISPTTEASIGARFSTIKSGLSEIRTCRRLLNRFLNSATTVELCSMHRKIRRSKFTKRLRRRRSFLSKKLIRLCIYFFSVQVTTRCRSLISPKS